jgi:hypothetical protein
MRFSLRFAAALLVLFLGAARGLAEDSSIGPVIKEVSEAFQREADVIGLNAQAELEKLKAETAVRLQAIQDRLCREAKLDEAVAVRDRIRAINGKGAPCPVPAGGETALPSDAQEISQTHETLVAALEKRTEQRILAAGRTASAPLERLMKELCRDEKLDDALVVREAIRQMTSVVRDVQRDPGHLPAGAAVGQVYYFELVGHPMAGSLYGTDIYTNDSTLATAVVHTGLLAAGEKGVVKVTVLPGQESYVSSTRCGITSSSYGNWSLSYKMEKARGIVKEPAKGE